MANGVNMVKDSLPYVALGTGGGMTQTPYPPLQVIGIIVGIIGGFAAIWRCWEAKRANDFDIMKWKHENADNTSSKETSCETEKETGGSES